VATLLSVSSSLLVGAILVVAPWTPFWDTNYLLQAYPMLRVFLLHGAARGTVSGLGLVNIVLALHETHQYLTGRGESA
jgi:hypothetical protein